MPKSSNSVASRKRRKKILKKAKGYFGRRKNVYTIAKKCGLKRVLATHRDRKNKKRVFRSLWITRINAAAREHGLSYSELINKLKIQGVEINRKVLADLAMNDPEKFSSIIKNLKA